MKATVRVSEKMNSETACVSKAGCPDFRFQEFGSDSSLRQFGVGGFELVQG